MAYSSKSTGLSCKAFCCKAFCKALPLAFLLLMAGPTGMSLRAQTASGTPGGGTAGKSDGTALKQIIYKWKKVRGARGYRVQVRDKNGKVILNERTSINQIRLILRPGDYEHRVAALNKFLRPASWTGWLPFAVRRVRTPVVKALEPRGLVVSKPSGIGGEDPKAGSGGKTGPREIRIQGDNFLRVTRVRFASGKGDLRVLSRRVESKGLIVVTVDAGEVRPGVYDIVLTNPGNKEFRGVGAFSIAYRKKTVAVVKKIDPDKNKIKVELPPFSPDRPTAAVRRDPSRPFTRDRRYWEPLLPGFSQFHRGEDLEGWIWAGTYGALTLGALSELSAANRVIAAREGDALQNLFADPVLLLATRSFIPVTNQEFLTLGIIAQQENAALAAKYARHQQNQAILGGVALLGYLGHIYRETFSDWNWQTAVPGLPQLQKGNYYWAAFWASSVAGMLGGSLYYANSARTRAATLESNVYYQLFNNPVALSVYYTTLTSTSQREALLLNGLQTVSGGSQQESLYNRERNIHLALGGLALMAYVGHIVHALYYNQPGKKIAREDSLRPDEPRSYFTLGAAPDDKGRVRPTFQWTLVY